MHIKLKYHKQSSSVMIAFFFFFWLVCPFSKFPFFKKNYSFVSTWKLKHSNLRNGNFGWQNMQKAFLAANKAILWLLEEERRYIEHKGGCNLRIGYPYLTEAARPRQGCCKTRQNSCCFLPSLQCAEGA